MAEAHASENSRQLSPKQSAWWLRRWETALAGALASASIGLVYSLYALRIQAPKPAMPLPTPTFDCVVFDSVVIGVFVGISP